MSAHLKQTARRAASSRPFSLAVAAAERARSPRAGTLSVITYHRVATLDDRPELDPALISATPDVFREQVAALARTGRVVTLAAVLDACREGASLPPGAVLVTFDDAYEDFERTAWPVLREHGVPATIFVPTAYPDQPNRCFWWDRLHRALTTTDVPTIPDGGEGAAAGAPVADAMPALRDAISRLPHERAAAEIDRLVGGLGGEPSRGAVLGWHALRRLAAEGVTLAPHSATHPRLDRVDPAVAEREIRTSLEDLERELGGAPRALAYPDGGHTPAVVAILRRLDFAAAFTTQRGVNNLGRAEALLLRRINVGRVTSAALLRAQLLGPSH